MKTIPKMLLTAALALSANVVMPSTYAADLPPAAARSPIVVYPQLATRSGGSNVSSALLERLRELRILRVLVGLDLKLTPSHQLSEAQNSRQRAELVTMQDALIKRTFGARQEGVVARFEDIPYLTLEVSEH